MDKVKISIISQNNVQQNIYVEKGITLREAIIQNNLSPYSRAFQSLNCKGLGICGTCKVFIRENENWWERRSCQIQCFQELEIRLK